MNKVFLAAATAVLVLSSRAGHASDDPGRHALPIVGAWQLEVTLRNCATGEVAPVPTPVFPGLSTFHKGGTLSELGSRGSPATRSIGHGIWKRTGRRTFESRFVFHRFDANGFFAGTQDAKATMVLSPDGTALSISTIATFTDVSGIVTPGGCSTQVGQRVAI